MRSRCAHSCAFGVVFHSAQTPLARRQSRDTLWVRYGCRRDHPGPSAECAGAVPAWRRAAATGAALFLGGVFLTMALAKSRHPLDTVSALEFVFPRSISMALTGVLIVAEIALGALLVARWRARLVLTCVVALMVVFLGWITYLGISRAPISCGCGHTRIEWLEPKTHLGEGLRTAGFLLVGVIGLVALPRTETNTPGDERETGSS